MQSSTLQHLHFEFLALALFLQSSWPAIDSRLSGLPELYARGRSSYRGLQEACE